ncbi:MAG: hypothetical protein JSR91_01540 [Proteobacteria bacterium]|nr:hypothetical protein [Pseudomonadota bacterium]
MAPSVEPPSNSLELEQEFQKWSGQIVRRPDGLPVLDPTSPTGYLMSPFSDLSDVAAAGRGLRPEIEYLIGISPLPAAEYAYFTLRPYLGHGGTFDYQRRAYSFGKDGLTQLRQFRNVSNFNVGLLGQQANLSLDPLLLATALYAAATGSPVFRVDQPYFLDPQTRELIEQGYRIGESGVYDSGRRP